MAVDIDYVLENGDPRLKTWPMMDTPWKTIVIIVLYLVFVKIIGPYWMQNKKPFELRNCMLIYNTLLVYLSSWMFLRFALYGWFNTYSWHCEPIDYSDDDVAVNVLITYYMFYISKFIELLDTIFFVLRKKYSQVTFLHVFHHGIVPLVMFYGCKYGGGGYTLFFPMLNSFVHIWMYLYYALSAMGPKVQKYLWWKKHLTKLQLIQFVIGIIYMSRVIITGPEECKTRPFITWLFMSQPIIFLILFTHFYVNSYMKKPHKHFNGVPISQDSKTLDLKMH